MKSPELNSQSEKSFDINKTTLKIYRNKKPVREILRYHQDYNKNLLK